MRYSKWLSTGVVAACVVTFAALSGVGQSDLTNAVPAGFDDGTNGMVDQATHDNDRQTFFQEVDTPSNGLGPVFNGTSCAGCHGNPVSGGNGQTTELRVGHLDSQGNFVNPNIVINNGTDVIPNRSLVNQSAICPQAQETAPDTENIHALRATVNTFGDGFVEAIPDQTLLNIARLQPILSQGQIHGEAVQVPVLEASGTNRVGRFGWKDQHASLLSFSADAYLNEQGITSRLLPTDVTSVCDSVTDPEDTTGSDGLADIDHFARFMRATKVPPVDGTIASQPDARAGSLLFDAIGCGTCHVGTMKTAPAGTPLNGGTFTVPDALGGKVIHPFSDFLLHDVGTGDGIVQNGPQSTAHKLRTVPLWGLRVRTRFMHDLASSSPNDAILRHAGEAAAVITRYKSLQAAQKAQLLKFLSSL